MQFSGSKSTSSRLFSFEINLASKDYRWVRWIGSGLWLWAALGLVAIAFEATATVGYRGDIARLDRSLKRFETEQKHLRDELAKRGFKNASPQGISVLSKQVAFANEIIRNKAFSWTGLLSDLENVIPPNISLKSILPSAKSETIHLSGTSLKLTDVTRLMNRLEASGRFSDALLADQKDTKEGRVEFSMTVRYHPGKS